MGKDKVKQTELGQVPEDWEELTLGELIDIKHGFAFKGEHFTEIPNENILLTPGNFNIGGGFKADKFKYYIGDFPSGYILHEGDIIITMTDLSKMGDTLGYPAKIPYPDEKNYLHNQRLGLVIFKSQKADKGFLYWLLRTRPYQRFIVNTSSGSTVKHTSPNRIKEFKFFAPIEILEQSTIAKILSGLDDKIDLNLQMNKTIEAIWQAVFKRWFVHFEFPNKNGKPYKSSSGKMVDSELGEIPEGWRIEKLGDVADVNWGDTNTTKASYVTEGYDAYSASGLDGKLNHYDYEKPGIILSAIGANCGDTWFALGKWSCIKNTIRILASSDKVGIEYVFLFTYGKDFWPRRGSAQPFISQTDARNLPILIPDSDTMNNFIGLAKDFLAKINENKRQSYLLSQILDSLLPRLMSGKIRVTVGGGDKHGE